MNTLLEIALRRARPGSGSNLVISPVCFEMNFLKIITVPFAIIGGQATKLYMPERMTLDWDLLVHTDNEAIVRQQLKDHQATEFTSLSIPGFSCVLPSGIPVDVLLRDDEWVEPALLNTKSDESGQPVLALEWLILMKLAASRVQDLADISRMLGCADETSVTKCRKVIEQWDASAVDDFDSLLQLGKLERGKANSDKSVGK